MDYEYDGMEFTIENGMNGFNMNMKVPRKKVNQKISEKNLEFSKHINSLVKAEIFDKIFAGKNYRLEEVSMKDDDDHRGKVYDCELGIDFKAHIQNEDCLNSHLNGFDVQSIQVRALEHHPVYPDCITISVVYPDTQVQSEYYKLDLINRFAWMFCDKEEKTMVDWVVVEEPRQLRELIRNGKLPANERKNPRTGQIFYSIKVSDLLKLKNQGLLKVVTMKDFAN